MAKYKLTVVFGSEACYYADEHGTKETVAAIERDEIEGMWRTYELDTLEDAHQLTQALNDAWGWEGSFIDFEQKEDGKWDIKFDD